MGGEGVEGGRLPQGQWGGEGQHGVQEEWPSGEQGEEEMGRGRGEMGRVRRGTLNNHSRVEG